MDSFTALAVFRNDYKDPGYFVSLEELAYAVRFGSQIAKYIKWQDLRFYKLAMGITQLHFKAEKTSFRCKQVN